MLWPDFANHPDICVQIMDWKNLILDSGSVCVIELYF